MDSLGVIRYNEQALTHAARRVYKAKPSAAEEDFECDVEVQFSHGQKLVCW